MHGYMNIEAFKKTIETKEAHYYSRSRKTIWHKGKTSGFVQKVIEIKIDDDQDSILLTVYIGDGASCHVGYRSCFYRSIPLGPIDNGREVKMKFTEKEKKLIQKKSIKDNQIQLKFKCQINKKMYLVKTWRNAQMILLQDGFVMVVVIQMKMIMDFIQFVQKLLLNV